TNHARRESRLGLRAPDHRKRSIASIIVTTLAAPKRTTNRKSPCPAARPQPSAASAESAQLPQPWLHPGCFHLALHQASPGHNGSYAYHSDRVRNLQRGLLHSHGRGYEWDPWGHWGAYYGPML